MISVVMSIYVHRIQCLNMCYRTAGSQYAVVLDLSRIAAVAPHPSASLSFAPVEVAEAEAKAVLVVAAAVSAGAPPRTCPLETC